MTWTAEEATQELLRILPLLNRLVAAEVRAAAGEDVTMPQFRVLTLLADEPLTTSALAKQRRVSLQSMSELVQSMVERGLVERTPDPRDRRQQLLQLTDRGREQHRTADTHIVRHLLPLVEALSEDELAAITRALPALRRVLTQEESEVAATPAEALPV